MITLSNGHTFQFVAAAGSLGLDGCDAGNGLVRAWKLPFRVFGALDPKAFTIVTKTLTCGPRTGNYRWWAPWRCFRFLSGGNTLNSIGLTNPGLPSWHLNHYPAAMRRGYKIIVSVTTADEAEVDAMVNYLNLVPGIVGVELNMSCPNVPHDHAADHIVAIASRFAERSRHPVILKLGVGEPYLDICKALDGHVEAFDLINAVPWPVLFPDRPSPLAKYGLVGGVSGPIIAPLARKALDDVVKAGVNTPVISGGGVCSTQEARYRFEMGAGAISFGISFLKPWKPNWIVRQLQEGKL